MTRKEVGWGGDCTLGPIISKKIPCSQTMNGGTSGFASDRLSVVTLEPYVHTSWGIILSGDKVHTLQTALQVEGFLLLKRIRRWLGEEGVNGEREKKTMIVRLAVGGA